MVEKKKKKPLKDFRPDEVKNAPKPTQFAGSSKEPREEGFRRIFIPTGEAGTGGSAKGGKGRTFSSGASSITAAPGEQVTRRNTGKGQVIQIGEEPPTVISGGGVNTTMFGGNLPGEDILSSQEVSPGRTSQDILTDPRNPQEQLADFQSQQAQGQFDQGLQSGNFGTLTLAQVKQFANEAGLEGNSDFDNLIKHLPEDKETDEGGLVSGVASLGLIPATVTANLISSGLKALGIADIGHIDRSDFSKTTLGKVLGITTVALGVIAGGKYALRFLPKTASAAKGANLATKAKSVIASTTIKNSVAGHLARQNLYLKLGAIAGAIGTAQGTVNQRISSLQESIINQREDMTSIVASTRSPTNPGGIYSVDEAEGLLLDMNEDVQANKKAMKITGIFSIKDWLGGGKQVETRIAKFENSLDKELVRLQNIRIQEQQPAPVGQNRNPSILRQ